MIEEIRGVDLFDVAADALVNPVNCKGVMGKGIALEVKRRYPASYRAYQAACRWGHLRPGMLLYVAGQAHERNIIHFATKDHWTRPSKLEWIRAGLDDLKRHYAAWGLTSVAMPQLGCGLGGLDWNDVQPLIVAAFQDEPLCVTMPMPSIERRESQDRQRRLF